MHDPSIGHGLVERWREPFREALRDHLYDIYAVADHDMAITYRTMRALCHEYNRLEGTSYFPGPAPPSEARAPARSAVCPRTFAHVVPPRKRGDRGGAGRRTRSSRPPAAAVLVRVGHTKPIPKVGPVTDP